MKICRNPDSKGKFQKNLSQCQAGRTLASTHGVGKRRPQIPFPQPRSIPKGVRSHRGARTVPRPPRGHRKQRRRRERPFSFVWVTHTPAFPGRRVLHFELPAAGPASGHLSAHATGASRPGEPPERGARLPTMAGYPRGDPRPSRCPASRAPARPGVSARGTGLAAAHSPTNAEKPILSKS